MILSFEIKPRKKIRPIILNGKIHYKLSDLSEIEGFVNLTIGDEYIESDYIPLINLINIREFFEDIYVYDGTVVKLSIDSEPRIFCWRDKKSLIFTNFYAISEEYNGLENIIFECGISDINEIHEKCISYLKTLSKFDENLSNYLINREYNA